MHRDANGQCVPNQLILPNNTPPQSSIQCRAGTVKIGRSCVPACPDGSVKPANGYCGPKIILRTPGLFACPPGQLRQPGGSCKPIILPQTQSPTINLHNSQKLLVCSDGQLRLESGHCPPPKPTINIKPFLFNKVQPNNGLH